MSPATSPGGMAKTSDAAKEVFRSLVPAGPGISLKPMFGSLAAFVNGNMFAGIFGEDLFVRASETQRNNLLKSGAHDFAPMPGRVMKGYVSLAGRWREDPEAAAAAVSQALQLAADLPAKAPKSAKKKTP